MFALKSRETVVRVYQGVTPGFSRIGDFVERKHVENVCAYIEKQIVLRSCSRANSLSRRLLCDVRRRRVAGAVPAELGHLSRLILLDLHDN